MIRSHSASFRAAEFGEYGAYACIVYFCRVEIWNTVYCGFEDLFAMLVAGGVGRGERRTYSSEKLMVVSISETTFLCPCYRCSEC
jgi:hypothetical protein